MCKMGLFLIGSNENLSFGAANENTYTLFDEKIDKISEFIFTVYGIWSPWERKAFRSYVRDKMEQKTVFMSLCKNKSAIFSELFEKECFESQANYFLPSSYPCLEKNTIVVGFYLCFDKLHVFVISDDFEKAFFTISNENNTYDLEFYNVETLQRIIKLNEEYLKDLCAERNFLNITKKLSLITGLRFDLSFEDVYKQRRKFKATEINTLH